MSAELPFLAQIGVGVVAWCARRGCDFSSHYLPIAQALRRFGPVTCEEAQRGLRCPGCGLSLKLLPSTLDMDDVRKGRPAGTTEAAIAARRAAETAR